ncbi:MAG: sugar phosphate nucleotidyltransferase, partial [Verrucomicrobiota bacterium]|nr:sugar phosphate nucleotidyltransferase [Verrucomicrobiota bacterium]
VQDVPATPAVYNVVRFREKPDADLADTFVRHGNFRWNAGMFIWSLRAIVGALQRHAPELGDFVGRVHGGHDIQKLLREVFPTLPKVSIDYAIMEKATRVLVVEATFDWDDVGSWTAVGKYLPPAEAGNISNVPVTALDASNNLIFSDQGARIALMGVADLIVVQTRDALLICNRHEAERIKQLVARVPAELQ